MTYTVMAHIVMGYIVMTYTVMAHIVMAYIVVTWARSSCLYHMYSSSAYI